MLRTARVKWLLWWLQAHHNLDRPFVVQTDSSGGGNRRQFFQLGNPLGRQPGSGGLVSSGSQVDLKAKGAAGDPKGSRGLPVTYQETSPPGAY